MALWSGRFEQAVSERTQQFGASLPVDKKLYREDIAGSIAHAKMLAAQGIISEADRDAIIAGLQEVESEIESGAFAFDINDEDIHMSIEAALTEKVGDAGARLHTARSRNDQVVTDVRLYAKRRCGDLLRANLALREALLKVAQEQGDAVLPGYTHLQHAQPVLLAHHLLAYYWMFTRDYERLVAARHAADANPLGAAALAGTSYPIDRQKTADELGFSRVIPNSLDAVSDRDFILDLLYAASVSCLHLSRLCEEVVLWSSSEFGFITLSDEYSTGSSIMPQKKNPDFAELIRGKSGRVVGDLVGLMVTLKSLPLAYNKDLQEDKEPLMDAADTLEACCYIAAGMLSTMQVNADVMLRSLGEGFIAATDIADYLAKRGLPFRQAHAAAGHLVLLCEKRGIGLEDLSLDDFRGESELFDEGIYEVCRPEAIVDARTSFGGTSHQAVAVQMEEARARMEEDRSRCAVNEGNVTED